jgi:hypothetical protein
MAFTLSSLVFACGGKVVFDGAAGASGAGGSPSSTQSATVASAVVGSSDGVSVVASAIAASGAVGVGSSGSGVDCGALAGDLDDKLVKASACNACKNSDDCANGPVLFDSCQCPRGLNGHAPTPDAVNAAQAAFDAFTASCAFFQCQKQCPIGGQWHCAGGADPSCDGFCGSP